MRLQAHGKVIVGVLQGAELSYPIDHPTSHCSPFNAFAVRLTLRVFAVHMANSMMRQFIEPIGKWRLPKHGCVTGIPIEHEVRSFHSVQGSRPLCPCPGVAFVFVFEQQDNIYPGSLLGGFA